MATYNGEKYLVEQIESIFAQTFDDFKLHINDDFSTDSTWDILLDYSKKYPDKVIVSQNEKTSGGAQLNFMNMMLSRQDEYIMPCDQDDVWLPEKLADAYGAMLLAERKYGKDMPILVHTDTNVVNESLDTISPSLKKLINAPMSLNQKQILMQNNVTGCTVLYNKALANLLLQRPSYFVMHDWWLAILANYFGETIYLDKSSVLYRQHHTNTLGAKVVGTIEHIIDRLLSCKKIKDAFFCSYIQADSFLKAHYDKLNDEQRTIISAYASLREINKISRIVVMKKNNLFRQGFLRTVSQLFFG